MQWALAYLAGAWMVMQLVDVLGSRWGIEVYWARAIDLLLVLGLLITLVVSWFHGAKGRQRVSSIELIIVAAVAGIGALGLSLIDLPNDSDSGTEADKSLAAGIDAEPWIAVLPFDVQGGDADLADFAEGLEADITSSLSMFSHLLVLSRASVEAAVGGGRDAVYLGTELGARYLLEGELRAAGGSLRLNVRLVDSRDGTTIWSERFDRALDSGQDIFAVQDSIVDRVVGSLGDVTGVVAKSLAKTTLGKAAGSLTPYEAILQLSSFMQTSRQDMHLKARKALEHAITVEPTNSNVWACLAVIRIQEYMHGYNELPDSQARALVAARRAVELDSANSFAHYSLALTQYFRKDVDAFRVAAERAVSLNPRDTHTLAMLGILFGYSGDWPRGIELTERAMLLQPDHPGWYRFATFFNEYLQANYTSALEIALRLNMPEYYADAMSRAAVYAKLGDIGAAESAVEELRGLRPDFESTYISTDVDRWFYNAPKLVAELLDGLEKAGLNMQGNIAVDTR